MTTQEHFPEVSNWERTSPDKLNVTNVWHNDVCQQKLRTRRVEGPFSIHTSHVAVEKREYGDSEWDVLETFGGESGATENAYEYAQEHNETSE